MKTTIEIKGYEIVIEETEDGVTVMAVQDGETVEEFTLEGEVEVRGDDMKSFGEEEDDFGGADKYEDEMDELGQKEDDEDDEDEDEDEDDFEDEKGFGRAKGMPQGEDEEEEEKQRMPEAEAAPKMESFGDFVRRTQKTTRRGR